MVSSGEARRSVAPRDFAAQHRAHGAMHIADRQLEVHRVPVLQRILGVIDELIVQRFGEPVILRDGTAAAHAAGHLGIVEDRRKIETARLPMIQRRPHFHAVHAADHLVHGAEAEFRHPLAHFLGDEEEKVDDVLGRSLEFRAQRRILRRDAHRAGVQVALAHHDAAHRHQRRGGKSELLGAQQRGDGDVAAGLQLAVGLHAHAAAQIVQHQHLLRFRKPQFPGNAGVFEGSERRRAGSAVIAR